MDQIGNIFNQMNEYFEQNIPYFFIVDYSKKLGKIVPLNQLDHTDIQFSSPNFPFKTATQISKELTWEFNLEPFSIYEKKFQYVKNEILKGNSYLVNLCCKTPVETNYSLEEIFQLGNAKYKLLWKDQFVHFSPEPFIKIQEGKIHTFPMKGTIDATIPNAKEVLFNDKKELTEHNIITDLMRNDLSIVADNVEVENFRYFEKIQTNTKAVYQTSSHIIGTLKSEYKNSPGNIFEKLLPAGSISGAPKPKTLKIIEEVEQFERGFYTGVWGVFDGKVLDSCVIIRMLEKEGNQLYFKSGGGITAMSDARKEYLEISQKIYVPIY